METIDARLAKLEGNPVFLKLEEEGQQKVQAKREQAAQEILQIQADSGKVLEGIREDREEAAAELKAAEQALKAKKEVVAKLDHELYQERHRAKHEKNQRKQILLTTYDPAIDKGIDFFRNQLDQIRKTNTSWQTYKEGIDLLKFRKKLVSYSNRGSILKALDYCQKAIQGLEGLKLRADFDPAWIEDMKINIPDPHLLEEYETDKPIKDQSDVNPLMLIKSEDQHEWELEKLNDKFKQVMSPKPRKKAAAQARQEVVFNEIQRHEPRQGDPEKKAAAFQAMREAKQKLEATR